MTFCRMGFEIGLDILFFFRVFGRAGGLRGVIGVICSTFSVGIGGCLIANVMEMVRSLDLSGGNLFSQVHSIPSRNP